jgi:quercetin 2,3-dioxygenase
MQYLIHLASSRGHANHGWLESYHTFSFANYYNPERMNFGVLRVLNDDTIAGGTGFGKHPHTNMEIVSIPLEGALRHGDDQGNSAVIEEGEVQIMSAGSGIVHSEMNHLPKNSTKFLQIWIIPNQMNVAPRYDQKRIDYASHPNEMIEVIAPKSQSKGMWLHQDARLYLGKFDSETAFNWKAKNSSNGIYLFVIEGSAQLNNELLERRDAMGFVSDEEVKINVNGKSHLLLMEVPLTF